MGWKNNGSQFKIPRNLYKKGVWVLLSLLKLLPGYHDTHPPPPSARVRVSTTRNARGVGAWLRSLFNQSWRVGLRATSSQGGGAKALREPKA